jgi:hypothetical protein
MNIYQQYTSQSFIIIFSSLLFILGCSGSEPEWKRKGFLTEHQYEDFLANTAYDSIKSNLPVEFLPNQIIGKYTSQYQVLSVDINGIVKSEARLTNASPEFLKVDLNHSEIWESLYGHGLKLYTNYNKDKYSRFNESLSFEYHEDDVALPYILGYRYFKDGSKDEEAYWISDGKDLCSYLLKNGHKMKSINETISESLQKK